MQSNNMRNSDFKNLLRHIVKEVLSELVTPQVPNGMTPGQPGLGIDTQKSAAEIARDEREARVNTQKQIKNTEDELRNKEKENKGKADQWKKDKLQLRKTLDAMKKYQSGI